MADMQEPKKKTLWPSGEAKRERKAAGLASEQWHREYKTTGSSAHQKYVDKLVYDISKCEADFITYDTDMEKWLDPKKARYDMELRKHEYCRNMFDYCISPLQHGVDTDTVLSCIGLYVGMSLFSKDFKRTVNTEVAAALMPVTERLGARNARVKDKRIERDKKFADTLERITGHKIPILSARAARHESGENMQRHDEKVQELRDRVLRGRNGGRVPFTAETGAIQYLNFMHQYYNAVREPDADVETVDKRMKSALDTLFQLCERDGVQLDDMFESVRTCAGHAMAVEPALQCEFEELGYENYRKTAPVRTTDPLGRCFDVWRGGFEDAEGRPLDGPLTVREPQDVEEHQAAIEAYMHDVFDGMESMHEVAGVLSSDNFQVLQSRFLAMMQGDFMYYDSQDRHRTGKDPVKVRDPQDVLATAIANVGKSWKELHPEAAKEYEEEIEAESIRKREARANWGPSQFDMGDIVGGLGHEDENDRGGDMNY